MTHRPMNGVRIIEVAQFTFVPAASAILADWGADVVKIEHAVHGDAGRGHTNMGIIDFGQGSFRPIFEHPNRGKRSVGLDLTVESARAVLYKLAETADVFLTNFLPDARRKLCIDVDDIRAVNPDIVYVRGSGFGSKGPDSDKGGFDGTAFWARGGSAHGITPKDFDHPLFMPSGAYGDSMSGMTLAGGIAGALFGRERTGEGSVVDVSLLATGAWAMGLSVNLSLAMNEAVPPMSLPAPGPARNPLHGSFRTADGRWLQLSMLQAGRYWADTCRHLGLDDLIDDRRFSSHEAIMAHAAEAHEAVVRAIQAHSLDEWKARLVDLAGAWAPLQDPLEVGNDPQLRANGYIRPVTDAEGSPHELLANPVQFDETPPDLERAPLFAEHTDEILAELGYDDDAILALKLEGAVT